MTKGMKWQMVFHVMILPKGLIIILSRRLTTYVTILSTPPIWQTLTIPWCPHLLCFLYRHLNMPQRKQCRRQCSHDLLSTVHLTQFQHGFWRMKNSIDILAPYLTELANQSFSSGVFPYDLKTAILKPLLKKLGLDPENFKNLRPISNIAFLSKLLESLACEQYVDHLKKCNLAEIFQSAYREGHNVETALVRVHNDTMRAFDEKKSVILVLLD